MELFLQAGADPNKKRTREGDPQALALEPPTYPPMHQICCALREAYRSKSSDVAVFESALKILLSKGAVVSTEHKLLHDVSRRNELQMAKVLVEQLKIDPNMPGKQDMTPLHFAARTGKA